jgi:hypothetical protein
MLSDIRDQIETPEWTREQRGPRMISFELAGVQRCLVAHRVLIKKSDRREKLLFEALAIFEWLRIQL